MKKKFLILAIMIFALVAIFTVTASAHDITRKVTLDDGTEVALYDTDGEALTWYLKEGALVSAKTKDVISVNGSGVATYNGISAMDVVVANFQGAEVEALVVKQVPSYYYGNYGGAYHSYNNTIEYIYLPDTLTATATNQFRCTSKLKIVDVTRNSNWQTMGQYSFYYATGLTEFYYPPKVKTTPGSGNDGSNGTAATFSHCTSLKSLYFYDNSEVETFGQACFADCKALETVELPNSITSLPKSVFSGCSSLKEISIPNSVKTIASHAFAWCTSLEVIRMGASFEYFNNTGDNSFTYMTGNVKEIYIPKTFYATAPDTSLNYQVSYAFHGVSANCKFFYCGTIEEFNTAKANFLTQKSATSNNGGFINATPITYTQYLADPEAYATGRYVICEYNSCDAFYENEHNFSKATSCKVDLSCERNCGYTVEVPAGREHVMVEYMEYPNGLSASGTYKCICTNADYCVEGEGYVAPRPSDPIIVPKGYSVPTANVGYIGINAGYEVKEQLFNDYTRINKVTDFSINMFMVNSQIKDEGTGEMVNISSILNGDTLETNLKGFMLEIKSLSYSTISIEIRGFEQKEENTGSYYELKLISAIVIKLTTAEGTTTQFIQSEIPNTDCAH